MSYQIEYPVSNQMERKHIGKVRRKTVIFATLIGCIIFIVALVFIVGIDTVKEVLIPGNDKVTISAFTEMQENLKNGMSAKDAVAAFCEEILESANAQ